MRRGRVRVWLATIAASCLGACASLFGIEELPLRPDPTPPINIDDGGDGGQALDCDGGRPTCACQKHDFCDDFDNMLETLGARWSAIPGAANPFTKEEAGISFTDEALSRPRALRTNASAPRTSAYAVLGHELDHDKAAPGRTLGGVRLAMYVRVDTLSFNEIRGPLPEAGSAIVAGMVTLSGITFKGVAVVVAERGVYFFGGDDVLEPKRPTADQFENVIALYEGPVGPLTNNWLRVEILVGMKEVAVREGFFSCSAVADGPVMAANLGPRGSQSGCTTLPASFGGVAWAAKPIVTAGAALFGGGAISIRQDDVTVDFLEP